MRVLGLAAALSAAVTSLGVHAQAPWQPPSSSQATAVSLMYQGSRGASFRRGDGVVTIVFWDDRTVRVTSGESPVEPGRELAVLPATQDVRWQMSEDSVRFLLQTAAMTVAVDKLSGAVSLIGADGKPIVAEEGPPVSRSHAMAAGTGSVEQRFSLEGEQAVYGLGQHQTGVLDLVGTTTRLQQANTDVGVPVLVSTRGYGLFWNNPAVTDVDVDIPQAREEIVFRSEAGNRPTTSSSLDLMSIR